MNIHFVGSIESLPFGEPADRHSWYTHPYKDEKGVPALQVWRDDQIYYLKYLNGNRFVVTVDGGDVWAAWSKGNDFGLVTAQVIGPILGLVLQLRGVLVLHASVIVWKGRALAIMGPRGTGKSTTAAALHRLGCHVLSDDIAALVEKDGTWWVQPGYPRLRLWPQTASALYGPQHDLQPIAPGLEGWDKRYLEFEPGTPGFIASPQTLEAIYIFNWGEEVKQGITIAPLTGLEALTNLDANSFMEYILDQDQRRRQMKTLANLMDRVSIIQVQPVPDLAALPDLAEAILERFEGIT